MKCIKILLPLFLLVMIAGCAAKGPVTEKRQDNLITFAVVETGEIVTVELGSAYTYDKFVKRSFKGLDFGGYLYTSEDESVILVSKVPRAKFEDLIGMTLDAPAHAAKSYPPKTIFLGHICKLVRTYVTTLDDEVVTAVKLQSPTQDEAVCEEWTSIDDVMADRMSQVAEFDKSADENIRIIRE